MRASSLAATTVTILAGVGSAEAGSFAVQAQSAYGQGSSFAGMAAPSDSISTLFWNPATVTTVSSPTIEGNITGIFPRSELDVDPTRSTLSGLGVGSGGDVGVAGVAPAGYFAMPINDELYLGVTFNAPYGLSTTSRAPWVGMFNHLEAKALSLNVTPLVGVKLSEAVSVAVGLQVEYFDFDIETALSPTAEPPRQRLEGASTDVGFVAGVTLAPFDGTTIGIGYRSKIEHSMTGSQTFAVPVAGGLIPAGRYSITADVTVPETVSIGVRQRLDDTFVIAAGVEWTNWSRIQTVPFVGSPARSSLALGLEDGWFFSLGGEYKPDSNWTFRGGLGYEIAPTTDAHRSMRLPDADRVWASVGVSYNWNERLSVDAGYSHLFVSKAPIDEISPAGIRYAGTAEGSADFISIGVRYKFGG